jgi:FkbM family methyltransferase
MISYAQNGEDVVLARAFHGRAHGTYVDLGAGHPVLDSVTKHFYDRGWSGLNVEPVKSMHEALSIARPRDVNLNVAVGRERGVTRFYEARSNTGLSSFSLEHLLSQGVAHDDVLVGEVEVVPARDLIQEHLPDAQITFIKIDIEGAEDQVIESIDWHRCRPSVLVIEAFYVRREDVLRTAGYRKTLWDGINTFWVRDEDAEELEPALSYPASTVLDRYDPWYYVSQILAAQDSRKHRSVRYDYPRRLWQHVTARRT